MIKALSIILLVVVASIYNSDLDNESVVSSVLLPIVSVLSLIALALWMVAYFHRKGINQTIKPELGSGIDFPGDGSGGGDGG